MYVFCPFSDIIETLSTIHDGEDEESTPIEIPQSPLDDDNKPQQQQDSSSINSNNLRNTSMPVSPAISNKTSLMTSNETEGDIIGQIDNWVMEPAGQGIIYKCRITRDRKGMDRGLFPIYYLHLEKDYGKKIFLLAGKLILRLKLKWYEYEVVLDRTNVK